MVLIPNGRNSVPSARFVATKESHFVLRCLLACGMLGIVLPEVGRWSQNVHSVCVCSPPNMLVSLHEGVCFGLVAEALRHQE